MVWLRRKLSNEEGKAVYTKNGNFIIMQNPYSIIMSYNIIYYKM